MVALLLIGHCGGDVSAVVVLCVDDGVEALYFVGVQVGGCKCRWVLVGACGASECVVHVVLDELSQLVVAHSGVALVVEC